MPTPPNRSEVSGSPSNAAANAGFGKLIDFLFGLLGNTGSQADARAALGISATNTPSTPGHNIVASNVQSALNEIGGKIGGLTTDMASDSTSAIASTAFVKAAAGGALDITMTGADSTLTAAQAVNSTLNVLGAFTGNRILNLPTGLKRLWLIRNNSTGAHTLTVKPTGGPGVTISQGRSAFVTSDGSAVYKVHSDILADILAVDGAGSGLDADLLDGVQGSAYARADGSNAAGAWSGISVAWSQVTTKPTTLSGYGITDARSTATPIGTSDIADGAVGATAKLANNIVTTAKLAREGTAGQILYSGGAGANPYYGSPPAGGVTSVDGNTGAVSNTQLATSVIAALGYTPANPANAANHTHAYAPMTAVVAISNSAYPYYCTATRANGATFTFTVTSAGY